MTDPSSHVPGVSITTQSPSAPADTIAEQTQRDLGEKRTDDKAIGAGASGACVSNG